MAEPDLTLQYDDFADEVSDLLGYGVDAPTSGNKFTRLNRAIHRGLRQFYNAYAWSFLRPQSLALTLTATEKSVDLDEDFGGVEGSVSLSTDTSTRLVVKVSEQRMRQLRQNDADTTGRPEYYALYTEATEPNATTGQVWTLEVWPKADQDYTLGMSYRKNSSKIDGTTNKFPLGGQAHGETMLEFMLAAAELSVDDTLGIHDQKAQGLLQKSIAHDRRFFGATSIGFMGNSNPKKTRVSTITWSRT